MRHELLARLLARQDAAFLPYRKNDQPGLNCFNDRMSLHFTTGTPWAGSKDGSTRKKGERDLKSLEVAGLVKATRQTTRISGSRLTDRGEQMARALVNCSPLNATIALVEKLSQLVKTGCCWDGKWVQETVPAGVFPDYKKGWHSKLVEQQFEILPALSRGWVTYDTNQDGNAYYAIARPVDAVPLPDLPQADQECCDIYDKTFWAEVEVISHAKPLHENNLCIGLPCSWPGTAYPTNPQFLKVLEAFQSRTETAATSGKGVEI